MEQPPGSLDDLQPQDLSTSGVPTVIDLTGKGDECVLDTAVSLDALRMVANPGWYPSSGASSPGLPMFSETSVTTLQPGAQVQPDNTFSHTTVTLSYVSRSHVFSPHDSLSHRSPLYSVSPLSKLSYHPHCDSDEGIGDNQNYVEDNQAPADLSTQMELFQSLSRAQAGPENHAVNGGVISSDGDVEKHVGVEEEHSLSLENSSATENGQGDSWSSSVLPETLSPAIMEEDQRGDSEVHFLMVKNHNGLVARDLRSLSKDYLSPLEDPVSPSATSQDEAEDVFILPQASSSPSADTSYLETADEAVWNGSSTDGDVQQCSGITDSTARSDSGGENKPPVHRRKALLEPMIDLTDDDCVSDISGNKTKPVVPHLNGNAKASERTVQAKKLPVRLGRGTRLEAIVMNINSGRYRVSGCIRTNKKAKASKSTASDPKLASPKKNNNSPPVGQRKGKVKVTSPVRTIQQKTVSPRKRSQTNKITTDSCKDSTSDFEINHSKKSHNSTSPKRPRPAVKENSKKDSVGIHLPRSPPPPPPTPSRSPKKSPSKAKSKAPVSKPSPTAKTKGAGTPQRRKRKRKPGAFQLQPSSMFAPKEPEIKLRYVNFKEEKREPRPVAFSPFVHVKRQRQSPSLCSVINYPEEVRTQPGRGQQQQNNHSGFISPTIPSTSCLRLGRTSTDSQHRRSLVCCLCGRATNSMGLGDLHGPYYPEGFRSSTKTPSASKSGLKENDSSDSDSSSCSVRGRGRRKRAVPHGSQSGTQPEGHRWSGDGVGSPVVKRSRTDDVEDWYSPPVLPMEPCEYWLHEDCGVWSAGVFLVKGRVYGLEEAVKIAQETTCSACQAPGASLGCFFKGCPNKYHYGCALESDCVLIEDNFSMKCKKHKNKTFKPPPGKRWVDR